jgi:hypothetical protein
LLGSDGSSACALGVNERQRTPSLAEFHSPAIPPVASGGGGSNLARPVESAGPRDPRSECSNPPVRVGRHSAPRAAPNRPIRRTFGTRSRVALDTLRRCHRATKTVTNGDHRAPVRSRSASS